MIHVTCLAHALHRVAEEVRNNYRDLDCFITAIKAIFTKLPSRIRAFHEFNPKIPLPPEPIITRWGTWISAVSYSNDHIDSIQPLIGAFDPNDAASTGDAIEMFSSPALRPQIAAVHANYGVIPGMITELRLKVFVLLVLFKFSGL